MRELLLLECPDHCCRYIIMHTYISHTHDVTLGAKVLCAGMIYGISTCFQVWYHIIPSNILQRAYSVLHLCFIVFYNLANTKGDSVFIYIRQVSNWCTNCPNSVAHLVLMECIHVLPSLSWVKAPIENFQQLLPFSSGSNSTSSSYRPAQKCCHLCYTRSLVSKKTTKTAQGQS